MGLSTGAVRWPQGPQKILLNILQGDITAWYTGVSGKGFLVTA